MTGRTHPAMLPVLLGLLPGCALLGPVDDSDTEPPPPPLTTRFVADATLRDCAWSGDAWIGVSQLRLTLEHRLDGPVERVLPPPGTCVDGLQLYAEQGFDAGDPIPGLDGTPRWAGPPGTGGLQAVLDGLWHGQVYAAQERCGTLEDTVGDGLVLEFGGDLSGLATPAAGTVETLLADGVKLSEHAPVQVGDEVALTWQAEGWDTVFVQVRRLLDGDARQVITCTPDGDGAWTLGAAAWDLARDGVVSDGTALTVGFVASEIVEADSGTARAEVVTRAVHTLAP